MKNILWLSRHNMLKCQLDELRKIFGDEELSIHIHKGKIPSAEWILDNLIKPLNIDIVIPVLPLTIISRLIELSKKYNYEVWWCDMDTVKLTDKPEEYDRDCEVLLPLNGKFKIVRFNKFYRIKEIKLVLEEIKNE